MLRCFSKQRCAASGLPPRWLDTRRRALRSARDLSWYHLGGAGLGTSYCGSARLLWEAAMRGDGPAGALARHTALGSSLVGIGGEHELALSSWIWHCVLRQCSAALASSDARRRACRRAGSTHGATLFSQRVRRAGASFVKLAWALRTAAVLCCFDKQRLTASDLPPHWVRARRYALRSAREASRRQLDEADLR